MTARPRFVVSSVTGALINPAAGPGQSSSRALATSFYVLDRGYCHRVVAAFNAGGRSVRNSYNGTDDRRRRLAEARAAELNAWDESL